MLKAACKGQAVIALSSGEAEYYGLVSAVSDALGEQAYLGDWGIKVPLVIHVDATAGASIASRRGLGRVKHIHTCYLWVQEVVNNRRVQIKKVPGTENPADLMTKAVDQKTIAKHMTRMGFDFRDGADESGLKA